MGQNSAQRSLHFSIKHQEFPPFTRNQTVLCFICCFKCQTPVWDVPTRKPVPKSSGPRKSLSLLLRLKHFRASKLTFFALACLNTCYYKSYWWCVFCWCWCHYWRPTLNAELTNLQKPFPLQSSCSQRSLLRFWMKRHQYSEFELLCFD